MQTQRNGGPVNRSTYFLRLDLPSNDSHSQLLTSGHWYGLMGIAVVLGVAWINLSQLPAHAVITEQWVHLVRMLLLLVFVPLVTSGVYLLCSSDLVLRSFPSWHTIQPSGSAHKNVLRKTTQRPSWRSVADSISIATILVLILLDVANFVAGRAYGTVTSVPWAVSVGGDMRHPVQLYSAFALSILLLVLWRMRSRSLPGEILWRFVLFYSLIQLILFDFCASAVTWGAGIRMEQILSLIMLLGGMYTLSRYAGRRADAATDDLPQEARF